MLDKAALASHLASQLAIGLTTDKFLFMFQAGREPHQAELMSCQLQSSDQTGKRQNSRGDC